MTTIAPGRDSVVPAQGGEADLPGRACPVAARAVPGTAARDGGKDTHSRPDRGHLAEVA
jgi:hypothetical protein